MATPLNFSTPPPPAVNGQDVNLSAGPGSHGGVQLPPSLQSLRDGGESYLGYGCVVTYDFDYGLAGQTPAGPKGVPTKLVRRHGGTCVKTVNVVATRLGQKPQLPAFRPGSDNEVLMFRRHANFSPGQLPDGTPIFGFVCQYVYQLQVPPGDNDSLDVGSTPVDQTVPSTYALNPADFVSYLMGTPAAVSGAAPVTVNY
jgi:hypothetical protein